MGKPIRDALAFDLPETAHCYAWYAEAIDKVYDEIAPTGPSALATITREPLGVVAAVVPWNYPLLMAAWKVAPALAAGNSVILKPAEQSSLSAIRLAGLAQDAGIPPGVFNVDLYGRDKALVWDVHGWVVEHARPHVPDSFVAMDAAAGGPSVVRARWVPLVSDWYNVERGKEYGSPATRARLSRTAAGSVTARSARSSVHARCPSWWAMVQPGAGVGVDQHEHAPERVVRRDAIGQLQKRPEPIQLAAAIQRDVVPALGAGDHRTHRNHQHLS